MVGKPEDIRILALVAPGIRDAVRRQIASLGMIPALVNSAAELVHCVRKGERYQVVLLPASLSDTDDWWELWGELAMLRPRPAILVSAQTATFKLWSGVLEAGGYDVIVEPLTEDKLKEALLQAADSYDPFSPDDSE